MSIFQIVVGSIIVADSRIAQAIQGQGVIPAHITSAVHRLFVPTGAIPTSIFQVTVGGIIIADSRVI